MKYFPLTNSPCSRQAADALSMLTSPPTSQPSPFRFCFCLLCLLAACSGPWLGQGTSKHKPKNAGLSTATSSLPLTKRFYQLSLPRAFLGHLAAFKTGHHPVRMGQPCPGATGNHLPPQQCWAGQEWCQARRGAVSLALWHPAWWRGQPSAVGEQQGQGCARREDKPGSGREHSAAQHGQGKALAATVKGKALTAIQLA